MSPISLQRYFHKQATKWALLGLGFAVIFSIPCVLYSQKLASERELFVLAKSVSRAFRPMVLDDNVRDAEFQIRNALDLKPDESVVIRSPDLKAVYPIDKGDNVARCTTPMVPCHFGFRHLSMLYPIYFDEQQTSLFGYIELTIHPPFESTTVLLLIPSLVAAFFTLALGLSSGLNQSAKRIITVLSTWASHLKNEPQAQLAESPAAPYVEFEPMKAAIDGLYLEIAKLKAETAKTAKTDGQLALLREISHDLRTPHSLLAKYFALHFDTVQTTGKVKQAEVTNIENTLVRMGEILRQVRVAPLAVAKNVEFETACSLEAECPPIVSDLKNLPGILNKSVSIQIRTDHVPFANISKTALFRIVDNLVSNAAEAVTGTDGLIEVEVIEEGGCPVLIVRDNGRGIPVDIRDKIFDFDFTTNFARGTGLGLGIVSKICQEFGAKISFESAEGVGTEFKVSFREGRLPDKKFARNKFSGGAHV